MKLLGWITAYGIIAIEVNTIEYDSRSRSLFISDMSGGRYIIKNVPSEEGNNMVSQIFTNETLVLAKERPIQKVL